MLNYNIQKQQNKKRLKQDQKYFIKNNKLLDWPVRIELRHDGTHVDHNQLDPLPFGVIHANIVLILKSWSVCATSKPQYW